MRKTVNLNRKRLHKIITESVNKVLVNEDMASAFQYAKPMGIFGPTNIFANPFVFLKKLFGGDEQKTGQVMGLVQNGRLEQEILKAVQALTNLTQTGLLNMDQTAASAVDNCIASLQNFGNNEIQELKKQIEELKRQQGQGQGQGQGQYPNQGQNPNQNYFPAPGGQQPQPINKGGYLDNRTSGQNNVGDMLKGGPQWGTMPINKNPNNNNSINPVNGNTNNMNVDDMAKRAIRGDFGNGQARRNALGNNYQQVQDRVNQMMQNRNRR